MPILVHVAGFPSLLTDRQTASCPSAGLCVAGPFQLSSMALALQSDADSELGLPALTDPEGEALVTTPPPKKSRKSKGQRKSSKKAKEPKQGLQQCGECGKSKPSNEFWEDQKSCKSCFNNTRSLLRIAKNQGVKPDVQKLKTEQPQAYQALNKAYAHFRLQQEKSGKKVKFSVTTFIVDWQRRHGFKGSKHGEMMWEKEFYEFAATAKMGYRTKEEARLMWQQMKAEADRGERASDEEGPRGFLRLYVHTKDAGEKYADVSQGRRYEMQETQKKASEEQIAVRRQLVFEDAAMEAEGDIGTFEGIRNAAEMGGSGFGTAIGLMAPDLHDMVHDAKAKSIRRAGSGRGLPKSKAKAKAGRGAHDGSGQESGSESSEEKASGGDADNDDDGGEAEASDAAAKAETKNSTAQNKAGGVNRKDSGKWYDAETKNLKAEKDFQRGVEALRESMCSQMDSMSAAVIEFRGKPEDAKACVSIVCLCLRLQAAVATRLETCFGRPSKMSWLWSCEGKNGSRPSKKMTRQSCRIC